MESNNNLNKLAIAVLRNYNITVDNIAVIQSGSIKTVWKIKTKDSILCLKRLKQSIDKANFSVNAQIYIKNSNGNVPNIVLDKAKKPIVSHNNELFVLYEWIKGRNLNFENTEDLSQALKGLAKFHLASKNYEPADNSKVSSKAGKWPNQYNSMKEKFVNWREISKNRATLSAYSSYLKYSDSMIDISNIAIDLLNKSSYKELTDTKNNALVLCHQDFGTGNALLAAEGVVVLDLDGVTFDLPSRDLRKIIGKQAQIKGKWDIKNIENVIAWYSEINPIKEKEKQILYIDLLFPHWFFGTLKNLFQNGKMIKPQEIARISALEESKVSMLKDLIENEYL